MNVLLVATYRLHKHRPGKPLLTHSSSQSGLSFISSVLQSAGHRTQLLVVTTDTPDAVLRETLDKFQPGLVGFTAVYTEYDFARKVAHKMRALQPDLFLIAGGVHVSLNPEETLPDGWDAICLGEGEYPMLELADRLEAKQPYHNIKNLWFTTRDVIIKNSCRPFLEELATLPLSDRAMWDPWCESQPERITILLGRGCPFECSYCCNHALKHISPGQYVRIRPAAHVMSEVIELTRRYPSLTSIRFEIETAGVHEGVVVELAERLRVFNESRAVPLRFDMNLRLVPKHDFAPLCRALKAANFTRIDIGLESGSERVRRDLLRRNYSNREVRAAVQAIRRAGLGVHIYVLIGIPGERAEEFQETVALLWEVQPDTIGSYIVFPYPGTEMFNRARQAGLLPAHPQINQERVSSTMQWPGFSRGEIEREFDWLPYRVYKDHRERLPLLLQVFRRKASRIMGNVYY